MHGPVLPYGSWHSISYRVYATQDNTSVLSTKNTARYRRVWLSGTGEAGSLRSNPTRSGYRYISAVGSSPESEPSSIIITEHASCAYQYLFEEHYEGGRTSNIDSLNLPSHSLPILMYTHAETTFLPVVMRAWAGRFEPGSDPGRWQQTRCFRRALRSVAVEPGTISTFAESSHQPGKYWTGNRWRTCTPFNRWRKHWENVTSKDLRNGLTSTVSRSTHNPDMLYLSATDATDDYRPYLYKSIDGERTEKHLRELSWKWNQPGHPGGS